MYIISVVLKNEQYSVALYNNEYKLLLKKDVDSKDISKHCLDIMSECSITPSDVDYIGIATDTSTNAPLSVYTDIEKKTGIKCYIAQVMSARALGEAYMTNDTSSLLMLKIDETIECGIIIDKKIYSGMSRTGAKVAHMVISYDGYECACGRKGCFEAYVSNSGLKRIAAESGIIDVESLTHKQLFDMNTTCAERAKKLYIEYLASGITNIINLFQPSELVLEGPFTEAGDNLMTPMMDIILREQYTSDMPNKCNVRFSSKKEDVALLGAALLGR